MIEVDGMMMRFAFSYTKKLIRRYVEELKLVDAEDSSLGCDPVRAADAAGDCLGIVLAGEEASRLGSASHQVGRRPGRDAGAVMVRYSECRPQFA